MKEQERRQVYAKFYTQHEIEKIIFYTKLIMGEE